MVGLKRLLFMFFVNSLGASFWIPESARYYIYRIFNIDVKTKGIKKHCYIGSNQFSIGEGSFVNYNTRFYSTMYDGGSISIGDNCFIAMNCIFITSTHEIGDSTKRAGNNQLLPIIVEDGCWIGANATILPGVTIGKGCIVAAGSVVNKDCKPNGLYAGVPARRVKDLP